MSGQDETPKRSSDNSDFPVVLVYGVLFCIFLAVLVLFFQSMHTNAINAGSDDFFEHLYHPLEKVFGLIVRSIITK